LGDGLPFQTDFKSALLRLVFGVADVEQFRNASLGPAVIVRLAEIDAWLGHITLSPTAITVAVSGSRVAGTQLIITGSSAAQFQSKLRAPSTVECPLPIGVPTSLWIMLSTDNQWLDYYHRDERWPIARRGQDNVTVDAGDASTEIAAIIARGEGLTTEFKED